MARKLNTGALIPVLGFGTGTPGNADEIKAAVHSAVKIGYRHFDTAAFYGTEAVLGDALEEVFQAGVLKRQDVFITTKLNHEDHFDVLPALKTSLGKLKTDYVDLYLMHAPLRTVKGAEFPPKESDFLPLDLQSTWKAMEECFDTGLAKAIGVCNFSTKKLQDLVKHARVLPSVNQVELHPVWQQKKLRDFAKEQGIQIVAWSPLGGMGKPWGSNVVLDNPIIKELAVKYNKSPAQVTLRWLTEIGLVAVIKSYNSHRLAENLSSFDFSLAPEDHEMFQTIPQKRLAIWHKLCNSTTSPYKSPSELWDGEI